MKKSKKFTKNRKFLFFFQIFQKFKTFLCSERLTVMNAFRNKILPCRRWGFNIFECFTPGTVLIERFNFDSAIKKTWGTMLRAGVTSCEIAQARVAGCAHFMQCAHPQRASRATCAQPGATARNQAQLRAIWRNRTQ